MNRAPRGYRPPSQGPQNVGPHYPRPRRPRPIFAPRDYWFFISLPIVVGITFIAGIALIGVYHDYVNIECEVVVVVTVTGKESYENTMISIHVVHEEGEDYKIGTRRALADPEGVATIAFALMMIGQYTLTARLLDDSSSPVATEGFELVSDDDGGTKRIDMSIRWKP